MTPQHTTVESRMRRQLAHRLDLILCSETAVLAICWTLILFGPAALVLTMLGIIPMSWWL